MSESKEFQDAFDSHIGTCRKQCACGRIHFDSYNQWDWEDGELDELKEIAAINSLYVEHDHGVGFMEIDGNSFVFDCPCKKAGAYEKFIKNHAEQIAAYLKASAKSMREKADAIDPGGSQ